jgi:hypothetical protein
MIVSNEIGNWDAFVAAWLPGTEGDGVAEVLFGDYDFTGKLPHTWPIDMAQVPINYGDSPYNPLFAYGYGLDYTSVAPAVSITNPSDGSSHPIGNVTIDAAASDGDGSITKVEFYEGSNYLGEDTSSPYSITWSAGFDGVFTITAKAIDNDGLTSTDSVSLTIGTGVPGQQPYHGTPFALPAQIEAEDYDQGGEGVAYQDAEENNIGGAYRPLEGVDIESCDEGGYNVGWMTPNEWLEYTIDAPVAGDYTIYIRVASNTTGGNFHLEFNGVDATGNIHVPVTGWWQEWDTISTTATLSEGVQIMRFVNANSGDEYNINYFDIRAPMVTVPDVVGDDQVVGHQAITGAGLTLAEATYSYRDTVGYNKILSQNPSGGTSIMAGSAVNTELSLGMRGDLDKDDRVDLVDFGILASEWGTAGTLADIEPLVLDGVEDPVVGDGSVDLADLQVLASYWLDDLN